MPRIRLFHALALLGLVFLLPPGPGAWARGKAESSRAGAAVSSHSALKTTAHLTVRRPVTLQRLKQLLSAAGAIQLQSVHAATRTRFEPVAYGAFEGSNAPPVAVLHKMVDQRTKSAKRLVALFERQVSGTDRRSLRRSLRTLASARAHLHALRTDRPALYEVEGLFRSRTLTAVARKKILRVEVVRTSKPQFGEAPPAASASDNISAKDFMPRLWNPSTALVADVPSTSIPPYPGPRGQYLKQHTVLVEWSQSCAPPFIDCGSNGLSWYSGDDPRERGFEIEVVPADETQLWSDDWEQGSDEGGTWASNLPDAYRDDLTSDGQPRNFAVGTPAGADIQENIQYWVNFDTNEGRQDTGPVRVRGQATTRAADVLEEGYCLTHFNADASCYFAADTKDVSPDYSLGETPNTRAIWGVCPPPYDSRLQSGECGYAH